MIHEQALRRLFEKHGRVCVKTAEGHYHAIRPEDVGDSQVQEGATAQ